jgi:hypothetical protein
MSRKFIYIVLIAFGYIILTSKSCGSDMDHDEKARLQEDQNFMLREMKDDFESEYLLEDRLVAYGEKAKQKLVDFTDYLNLYSCKDLDTLFKQQVRDMIYRLFYNKNAVVQLTIVPENRAWNNNKSLTGLLNSIDTSTYKKIEFVITDLKTVEPLRMENTDHYAGKIECGFRISGISKSDTTLLYEKHNEVRIIAAKTGKQFGADTALLIWQVFLNEINGVN